MKLTLIKILWIATIAFWYTLLMPINDGCHQEFVQANEPYGGYTDNSEPIGTWTTTFDPGGWYVVEGFNRHTFNTDEVRVLEGGAVISNSDERVYQSGVVCTNPISALRRSFRLDLRIDHFVLYEDDQYGILHTLFGYPD